MGGHPTNDSSSLVELDAIRARMNGLLNSTGRSAGGSSAGGSGRGGANAGSREEPVNYHTKLAEQ